MAYSSVTYTANGATTQFAVPFGYIRKEHVFVNVNQISTAYTWVNDSTVQLAAAPTNGAKVEVLRATPAATPLVDFTDGSTPVAIDFDTSNLQHLYLEQELLDAQSRTVSVDSGTGLPTLSGSRLTNVGTPINAGDATNKSYVDSLTTSSASSAYSSAIAAAASEAAAGASAANAASSAASAAALLDNFDDRYLGSKTADPTVDNDGNPLLIGAIYYNSTTSRMRVYTSLGWVDASTTGVGTLSTFEFVATGGQTVFTGNDVNGVSLAYTSGSTIVSLNGSVLRPGDDYTATNGTSITLAVPSTASDELQVMAFGNFNVASHYTKTEADALFQTIAGMSAYLTTAAAAATYVNKPKAFFYAGF